MHLCRRDTRESWEVAGGHLLGRLKACQVCIEESSISRKHAAIEDRDGTLWIVDQGSSNGIFRNGQKTRAFPLLAGDLLTVGKIALDVVGGETDAAQIEGEEPQAEVQESQVDAERAQLRRELGAPRRSKGFGDLDQQPIEIKLLALVLGGGLLWGMMALVQWISTRIAGGAPV